MNRLVPYTATKPRKVRGTKIAPGDQLFAIQDPSTKLFFIWSYLDYDMALLIAKRVHPSSEADISANWRKRLDQITPTAINI